MRFSLGRGGRGVGYVHIAGGGNGADGIRAVAQVEGRGNGGKTRKIQ